MKSEIKFRNRSGAHASSRSRNFSKKRAYEEIKIGDDDSDIEEIPYKQRRSQQTDYGPNLKAKLVSFLLWMKGKTMFQSFITCALKSFGYNEENLEDVSPNEETCEIEISIPLRSGRNRLASYEKPDRFLTIGNGRLSKFKSLADNGPTRGSKRAFPDHFPHMAHSTPFSGLSERRPLFELSSVTTRKPCNSCNTVSVSVNHKCPQRLSVEMIRKNSNAAKILDCDEIFARKGKVDLAPANDDHDVEFIKEVPPSDVLCSRTRLVFPCSKPSENSMAIKARQGSPKSIKSRSFTTNEVINEKEKEMYKILLESYFIDGRWDPTPTKASFRSTQTQADLDCEIVEVHSTKEDISRYLDMYHQKRPVGVKQSEATKPKSFVPRPVFKPAPPEEEVLLLEDDSPFVFKEEPRKPMYIPNLPKSAKFFTNEWLDELKKSVSEETEARHTILEEQRRQIEICREKRRQKLSLASQPVVPVVIDEFPELSAEMESVIDAALIPYPPKEVLSQFNQQPVLRKDMETVNNKNWLNDEIINFYFLLIVDRSKLPGFPSTYAFNSFFYPSLKMKGYPAVRRWTRKVDIFSYDMLLVPLHLGCHWCLAAVDFREKSMKFYDSMGGKENCLEHLRNYVVEESLDKKKTEFDLTGWSFEILKDIPQQMNGYDCGMFALKYAEYLTRDAPITFTQENMQYFRRKMIYEIMTQKLF